MGHHMALGIRTASARTRIPTLLVDAGPIRRTVRIQDALRTAHFVRIAGILRNTLAGSGTVLFAAHGVRTARTRLTRTAVHWRIG